MTGREGVVVGGFNGAVARRGRLTVVVGGGMPFPPEHLLPSATLAVVDDLEDLGAWDFDTVASALHQLVVDHDPVAVAAVLESDTGPMIFLFDAAWATEFDPAEPTGEIEHVGSGRTGWTTELVDGPVIRLSLGTGSDATGWSELRSGVVMGDVAIVDVSLSAEASIEPGAGHEQAKDTLPLSEQARETPEPGAIDPGTAQEPALDQISPASTPPAVAPPHPSDSAPADPTADAPPSTGAQPTVTVDPSHIGATRIGQEPPLPGGPPPAQDQPPAPGAQLPAAQPAPPPGTPPSPDQPPAPGTQPPAPAPAPIPAPPPGTPPSPDQPPAPGTQPPAPAPAPIPAPPPGVPPSPDQPPAPGAQPPAPAPAATDNPPPAPPPGTPPSPDQPPAPGTQPPAPAAPIPAPPTPAATDNPPPAPPPGTPPSPDQPPAPGAQPPAPAPAAPAAPAPAAPIPAPPAPAAPAPGNPPPAPPPGTPPAPVQPPAPGAPAAPAPAPPAVGAPPLPQAQPQPAPAGPGAAIDATVFGYLIDEATGFSTAIQRTVLLGSNPSIDPEVSAGQASMLVINDPNVAAVAIRVEVGHPNPVAMDISGSAASIRQPEGEATELTSEPQPLQDRTALHIGQSMITFSLTQR